MSQTLSRTGSHDDAIDYEIRVEGHIAARWAKQFGAATLVNEPDGAATLTVGLLDQAALHGVLQKIRDLGLPLVSVIRAGPDRSGKRVPVQVC